MKLAFIVNGGPNSAMAERAQSFASRLSSLFEVEIAYRGADKFRAIGEFAAFLKKTDPDLTYVLDLGFSGMLAAAWHRLIRRGTLVADTGDAMYELMRSSGGRGPAGLALTWLLEEFSLKVADHVVVRGDFHRELLAQKGIRADAVPDGVDCSAFRPVEDPALRTQLGLDGFLTVGLVGSTVWSERQQMCYGWDMVEAVRLVQDLPVKGLMIGDGDGVPRLKQLCERYGITDRIQFLGRVPYADLPRYLSAMDVCLSTQTNNVAGQVRTTGKLPLYLAAGRYVLASRVGQAARILPEEMLVDYEGEKDTNYPARLAARLRDIAADPTAKLAAAKLNPEIASRHFDYAVLAARLERVLRDVLSVNQNTGVGVARS